MPSRNMLIIYSVCITVVILFAVAFIGIAALYFNSKKRLYVATLEDPRVQKDVDHDLAHLERRYGDPKSIAKGVAKRKQREKKSSRITSGILIALYVMLLAVVTFAVIQHQSNGQMFFGDTAMLVIQTDSMSEVYSANKEYLKEQDLLTEENRIPQYAFITIRKVTAESEPAPYNVYAFKMDSAEEGKTITVVHRLVEVTIKDGEKLYTFRGDANPASMAGETLIPFDRIVGEWTGYQNLALGMFTVYLQSSVGIITLLTAFLLLIIYSVLYGRVSEQYEIRYEALLYHKLGYDGEGNALPNEDEEANKSSDEGKLVPALVPALATSLASGGSDSNKASYGGYGKRLLIVSKKPEGIYLEQAGSKRLLSLVSKMGEPLLYAYYGSLSEGDIRLVDKNGNNIASKKGYKTWISFGTKNDEHFEVLNPKASLEKEDGEIVYFLSAKSSLSCKVPGKTFLSVRLEPQKTKVDYDVENHSSIHMHNESYLLVKKGKKNAA